MDMPTLPSALTVSPLFGVSGEEEGVAAVLVWQIEFAVGFLELL